MPRKSPATSNGRSNGATPAVVAQLQRRLAALEEQVASLKTAAALRPAKDWRRTIGMFTGDEMMKQIMDEALKYRERDRERARRRYARPKRARK